MSWSIQLIGKPENITKALQAESERLKDESKLEFDAALPHLLGLLGQNFSGDGSAPYDGGLIKLVASGHGSFKKNADGTSTPIDRNCRVSIEGSGARAV